MRQMDDPRAQRLGANEALFRSVNEAIERGQWPGEDATPTAFRCECARADCNRLLELTPREYQRVRMDGRRFVVIPGHEHPEVETVIETRPGYVVVEKFGAAAEEAEEDDPRE
jgi:hypothetical protein